MIDSIPSTTSRVAIRRRFGVVACGVLAAQLVILAFWGPGPLLAELPWFVPMVSSYLALASLGIGALCFGRHRVQGDSESFWLSTAFVVFAVLSLIYQFTWPGLEPGRAGFISQLANTESWLWHLQFSALAVLLLVALLIGRPSPRSIERRWRFLDARAAVILTVAVCGLLIFFERWLPALSVDEVWTPLNYAWIVVLLLGFAAGAVVSARRAERDGSVLFGYLAILQLCFALAMQASLVGGRHYDLWWYWQRLLQVGGLSVLLFGLLADYAGLYQRERERSRQLEELGAQLEQRVSERTAELRETIDQLDSFSHSVSHDLRAPLRSIQGFAELLVEECADGLGESGRDYVRRIAGGAARMDTLIVDLLAYSRISRAELTRDVVSLDEVVSGALAQLGVEPSRNDLDLVIERPLPTVVGHRPTLEQVVANLVGNALKFVASGRRPMVCVRAERGDGSVRLWVEDNGIGIAVEHRDLVFGVFERLNGREQYPGTGIGLAIVRKGAERMGGRVGVESEVGFGSRFWVDLPAG